MTDYTPPMALPRCHAHDKPMALRSRRTAEQQWCGTWYDAECCTNSTLFPSPELRAALAKARGEQR